MKTQRNVVLQGGELEFTLSPKDARDLTKSFAVDLVEELASSDMLLVLPTNKPNKNHTYFLTNGSKVY